MPDSTPGPALGTVIPAGPAACSVLYNGRFKVPTAYDPVEVPAGGDEYVRGGWRVVCHEATSATAAVLDPVLGGLAVTGHFTGGGQYAYLRQLVPDLTRVAGQQWTAAFEIAPDEPVDLDFYVRCRLNADNDQRLLCADTDTITAAPGRQLVGCTFTAPPIDDPAAAGWAITDRACTEVALRLVSTSAGDATLPVWAATMVPGPHAQWPPLASPEAEQRAVEAYDESGSFRLTGLSSEPGQKSVWVPYRTRKARTVTTGMVELRDLVGTAGCVSAYDRAGVRTDGVKPHAIGGSPTSGLQTGFSVILANDSPYVGLAADWTVRNY